MPQAMFFLFWYTLNGAKNPTGEKIQRKRERQKEREEEFVREKATEKKVWQ